MTTDPDQMGLFGTETDDHAPAEQQVADAAKWQPGSEFSMACVDCDDGTQFTEPQQAIKEGWSNVQHDPEGLWWTHLGLCKPCQRDRNK